MDTRVDLSAASGVGNVEQVCSYKFIEDHKAHEGSMVPHVEIPRLSSGCSNIYDTFRSVLADEAAAALPSKARFGQIVRRFVVMFLQSSRAKRRSPEYN